MNIEALLGIFSAFGLSASAGLNAYIPLLAISLIGKFTDAINLTTPWNTLESWWVIGVLVFLSLVEFFVDKIPFVHHINNILQTFIRPVAGAIAFASATDAVTEINPVFSLMLGLLIAGGVHTTKSAVVRPMLSLTTGGTANTPVSIAEDIISAVVSIVAIVLPVVVAVLLILATTSIIWWMWRRANREKQEEA